MKEGLERLLISIGFILVGFAIVFFELILTPKSWIILLYLFFIPIPLIAVGVFFIIVGIIGLIALILRLKA